MKSSQALKPSFKPPNKSVVGVQLWHKTMPDGVVRYYYVELTQDLFDAIVLCRWGSLGSRRGGYKAYPVSSHDEARVLMDSIAKRRLNRGYVLQDE